MCRARPSNEARTPSPGSFQKRRGWLVLEAGVMLLTASGGRRQFSNRVGRLTTDRRCTNRIKFGRRNRPACVAPLGKKGFAGQGGPVHSLKTP